MASSGSSSILDLLEVECPDIGGKRRRRRSRRNKHVNPTSQRNLVKPPPPPPKCKFRQPSLIDPDGWVVLVRCKDDESLHNFDEKLPLLAAKAGIDEAILRSHGYTRLVYVLEEGEKKARDLATLLKSFSAVFVGRTHKPFVRERTVEVHGLPNGVGYDEINDALDCQFPGKSLTFDVLISHDPRREPEREVLIVTHDSYVCHQLLNSGGLKLFDDRLTYKCSERSPVAAVAASKWKKKKSKIVPESERQCFKCLAFGHMAESCDAPPRCKRCAGPHSHRECSRSQEETEIVCVNCGSQEHKAASRTCPMRPGVAEKKKHDLALSLPPLEGDLPSPPPSPLPSPEGNSLTVETSGSSLPSGDGEGLQLEGVAVVGEDTPPSSEECQGSELVSEEEYAGGEASTEEPRDSSDMASPEGNATTGEGSENTQEAVTGGVSSTTSEAKEADEATEIKQEEVVEESPKISPDSETIEEALIVEKTEDPEEDNKESNDLEEIEEPKPSEEFQVASVSRKLEDSGDETDEKNAEGDDVLYFTGNGKDSDGDQDAPHRRTASAVASFFSDLFGAAEAPSKPLDGNFVATLRSLQESVYKDIASRHPRRGATSPREKKPAKKRRLAGPLAAAAAAAAAAKDPLSIPPVLSPISTPEKVLGSPLGRRRRSNAEVGDKASRSLAERRLRVLEQFLYVVGAILDIE